MTIDRHDRLTRRDFVGRVGLAALAAGPLGGALGDWRLAKKRRLLCFTKSSGFEHSVIKRGPGDAPSLVERVLTDLGARHGFDVVCTKDGSVFSATAVRDYDAFFFFTSGYLTEAGTDKNPPMSAEGKAALLAAVRGGKGFVGVHSASDSFHTLPDPPDRSNRYVAHAPHVDPYIAMLGGEFILHGKIQPAHLRVVDARFPGAEAIPDGDRVGEWYSLKEFAPDLHAVHVLDTQGMTGAPYQRGPYPVTWARPHGKGRVFYTALGHREAEWEPEGGLPGLLTGALRWAFGDATAAVTPNLEAVAPRARELPPPGR